MNQPLVSIIIPTYNRAHLIGETLDSVIAQSYQNWECIIVDDGSTDNTVEVVNNYVNKDTRFQYHQRPADRLAGGNAARNYGFEVSRGEYINWFDSDDIMLEDKIKLQVEEFVKDKNIEVSITRSFYYNFITKKAYLPWRNHLFSENLLNDFICQKVGWQTGDGLWSKYIIDKIKFNESLKSSQDWEFHIRAIILNSNFSFTNLCLSYIRHTENSIKNSQGMNKTLSDYKARELILKFNLKYKKIDKNAYKFILDDLYRYFEFFAYNDNFKFSFSAFKKIVWLTLITNDYKRFFLKFGFIYINKIFKKYK